MKSRTEENKKLVDSIDKTTNILALSRESREYANTCLLADISKSFAVIADFFILSEHGEGYDNESND